MFSETTPAWLTSILTQRGGLIAGQALHVEQSRDPNPFPQNATLLLTHYDLLALRPIAGYAVFEQSPDVRPI
jgi:hypothetical protein